MHVPCSEGRITLSNAKLQKRQGNQSAVEKSEQFCPYIYGAFVSVVQKNIVFFVQIAIDSKVDEIIYCL